MSSVRLHPKYGVNPTIPTCFWCRKDRNEVVLLGAAYKGEAPMHMLMDYQPCDECKANWARGILLIEVSETPLHPNQRGMYKERWPGEQVPYPTGTWCVIKEEVVDRLPVSDELKADARKCRRVFVEIAVWTKLGFPRENLPHGR
jgi:hypothetical protein